MYGKVTFLTLGFLLIIASISFSQNLTPKEQLGKKIFFDKLSNPDWMACANCHAPETGFVGPIPGINKHGAVYFGAVPQRAGNRKPPSAAYSTFSPVFHYDSNEELFIGGNFWDGRATGERLGNPAADQALGPFLNPVEQNNAGKLEVLEQIAQSKYIALWEIAWGEPLTYETSTEIDLNYDRVGLAIAAYEASTEVSPFSSKYDYYLQGLVSLTPQEMMGLNLFNDEDAGKCALCHTSEQGPNGEPPLFTDFTFDNLGTPKNPDNPFYDMDEVYLDNGSPINPMGDAWIDKGLGGFLESRSEWQSMAAENMGKHKVPTLRNVDQRPGNNFPKAYLHNGVFKSLKEVVHFYNTRDVAGENWPPPEVSENVNTEELGDLGLDENEEDAIVAFLKTLSDGYNLRKSGVVEEDIISGKKPASLRVEGPNPFNPTTTLGYYLPVDANVHLDIYSITGEKVAVLQQGYMSAGEHQVQFEGRNLASGIYLAALNTGKAFLTIKLMLLK